MRDLVPAKIEICNESESEYEATDVVQHTDTLVDGSIQIGIDIPNQKRLYITFDLSDLVRAVMRAKSD